MTKINISLTVCTTFLISSLQGQAAGIATVANGVVVDGAGKPIANAKVIFRKEPKFEAGPTPFVTNREPGDVDQILTGVSGADGGFSLQGFQPNRYSLCADFPDLSHLNTCLWGSEFSVDMGSNAGQEQLRIVAAPAAAVSIEIADPSGLLPPPSLLSGSGIVVGVMTVDNSFYAARVVSSSGGERRYSVAVPLNQPLRLWLFSRNFGIVDPSGAALNHLGVEIPFTATFQSPISFSYGYPPQK